MKNSIRFKRVIPAFISVGTFSLETQEIELVSYSFAEVAKFIEIIGEFDPRSCIKLPVKLRNKLLLKGATQLTVRAMNKISNKKIDISICDFEGRVVVTCGSSGKLVLGRCGQLAVDVRLGHNGMVIIGDKTTINGARIIAIKNTIQIGYDCLLSDDILLQGYDQHGIIDLKSKKITNIDRKGISIGRHCWIGRRAIVMPAVKISDGAIVGANALVTKNVDANTAVGGVPALVLRTETTWTRNFASFDDETQIYLDSIAGTNAHY